MYELFYNWLLPISCAGALAVLVYSLLAPLRKKLPWRLQRGMLAWVLLFFAIPVGPLAALLPLQVQTAEGAGPLAPVGAALDTAAQTAAKAATTASLPQTVTPPLAAVPMAEPGVAERLLAALPWVWLAGVILLTGWQLWRYYGFCRGLARVAVPAEPEIAQLWQGLCGEKGLLRPASVSRCPGLPGPVLVGLLNPHLYLPQALRGHDLELALRHELAHVGRADLWLKALGRGLVRLHWFNPLCHLLLRRLELVCEYACDEQAAAGLSPQEKKAYGQVLLACVTQRSLPAGTSGMGGGKKALLARLEALFAPAKASRKTCCLLAVLLAGALLLTACASAGFAASAPLPVVSGSAGEAPASGLPTTLTPKPTSTPKLLPTPEPTPEPTDAVPTPIPKPSEKPALQEGETEVRWARWQQETGFIIEYTLDETLPEGEEELDREGVSGLLEMSGWQFLNAKGEVMRTVELGSVELQPSVRQLVRSNNSFNMLAGGAAEVPKESVGTGTFVWPVPEYKYVSRWMNSSHKGADICAAHGDDVCAMDGGLVITAGWHYAYGNYVIIDHGTGYRTLYAHMSELKVKNGESVKQGQLIGLVGSTGNSTGNHCHVELYKNDERISLKTCFPNM